MKFKKLVRDIQARSGWGYAFCHHLVTRLGYEEVSSRIDEYEGRPLSETDLDRKLNAEANARRSEP